MSYATEAELAALFITAKDMAPLRQTLIEMKWPQGQSPIQTNNSIAVGVTNNTIAPQTHQVHGREIPLAPLPHGPREIQILPGARH